MGRAQFGPVAHQFRHLFEGRSIAGVSEWQLLRRYLDRRDEVAFEAIVSRHGPMVLGVCRRLLADGRDVEDAFQATFVILARKGGTLAEADPVAHWLYGVAHKVALRARASAARRRRLERSGTLVEVVVRDDPSARDLAGVIDQELARLPERYRAPVVLCYLEGQTHEEAAHQLGWPLGTVKGRLSRARDLLKRRLSRRGIAPGGLIALARGSRAGVPRPLLDLTIRAATAGRSAGMVPGAVASLAAGSLATMFLNKLKVAGVMLLVLATGAAVMAYQVSQTPPRPQAPPSFSPRVIVSGPSTPVSDVSDWAAGWPELTTPSDKDPRTRVILDTLDEAFSMRFPSDTPFGDVVKYIKAATIRPALPQGIPIYVDPEGLQEVDKAMSSTVAIDLEGVPLKQTLRLLLKQMSLEYQVKDGLLTINAPDSEDQVTPFHIMEGKAKRGELTREQYRQLIEALKYKREVETLMNAAPQ